MIKVLENVVDNYMTHYTDSKNGATYEFNPDTIRFDTVGIEPRTFLFLNLYIGGPPIVPTGIDSGDTGMIVLLSLIAILSTGLGIATVEYIKRRTTIASH